jgi:hypothetical protein
VVDSSSAEAEDRPAERVPDDGRRDMADVLLLEFEGVGLDEYRAVNQALGIDAATGGGVWPEGLLLHSAGAGNSGLVVYEVWESQDAQGRFMRDQLGPALQEGGITGAPSRVEWLQLGGSFTSG